MNKKITKTDKIWRVFFTTITGSVLLLFGSIPFIVLVGKGELLSVEEFLVSSITLLFGLYIIFPQKVRSKVEGIIVKSFDAIQPLIMALISKEWARKIMAIILLNYSSWFVIDLLPNDTYSKTVSAITFTLLFISSIVTLALLLTKLENILKVCFILKEILIYVSKLVVKITILCAVIGLIFLIGSYMGVIAVSIIIGSVIIASAIYTTKQ